MIKKTLLISTLCLSLLSGCQSSQDSNSNNPADDSPQSDTVSDSTSTGDSDDTPADGISISNSDSGSGSTSAKNVGTFETTDINGTTYDQSIFEDYDLTLVNVFATWCGPCVGELPELESIYQNLGETYNINVIGIVLDTVDSDFQQTAYTDEVIETAKLLAEKTGCTFPYLIPDETALNGRLVGINAIPESFFVDKNGNIVGDTYTGARKYEAWEEIITTELQNLNGETIS